MDQVSFSPEEPNEQYSLTEIDFTEGEILDYIGLMATPALVTDETALDFSLRGLYTPTNEVVFAVLERLKSDTESDEQVERNEGDFLSSARIMELRELLRGIDNIEKRVEYTRLFMKHEHRKWKWRQARLARRRNLS